MRISELIAKLQAFQENHGDIVCYTASDDEMNEVSPVWAPGIFWQNDDDPEIIYNDVAEAESDEAEDITAIVVF